jgi:hypothetical protein
MNAKTQTINPGRGESDPHLELRDVNVEGSLPEHQKYKLLTLLFTYQTQFSKKPGKCNCFEYSFQVQGGTPKFQNCRPIPFALHKGVREQIEEMISDSVVEESYSSYVNPITLVQKEGRRVRICLYTMEVNKFMTPDRAKVPAMHMLLQRFHGASYISTLDLSSAFLQIPLDKASRKWTDFQFQNKVYQFTRVPYGFRNSLSAFIRGKYCCILTIKP